MYVGAVLLNTMPIILGVPLEADPITLNLIEVLAEDMEATAEAAEDVAVGGMM
jgi:hypothetical protein